MSDTPEGAWEGWTPAEIKKKFVKVYKLADGKYDALAENCEIPAGAVLLDPQPKRKRKLSGNPHAATNESLAKLEKQYPDLINWACYYAVQIAKANLTVHSREVRAKMADVGLVSDDSGPEHWMGAVFKRLKREDVLVETNNRYKYTSESRGIHEREVKIWALKNNADTSKYNEKPTRGK